MDKVVNFIEKNRGNETKIKSVAFAFLLNFEKEKGKQWQYTTTEIEFAHALAPFIKKLLEVEPERYHDALQDVSRASGSTEIIEIKEG